MIVENLSASWNAGFGQPADWLAGAHRAAGCQLPVWNLAAALFERPQRRRVQARGASALGRATPGILGLICKICINIV